MGCNRLISFTSFHIQGLKIIVFSTDESGAEVGVRAFLWSLEIVDTLGGRPEDYQCTFEAGWYRVKRNTFAMSGAIKTIVFQHAASFVFTRLLMLRIYLTSKFCM